ncbi:MAG: hypothetical protein ACI8PZ_000047 [Myxococcota bacterium]|jgi:hypothetical protein
MLTILLALASPTLAADAIAVDAPAGPPIPAWHAKAGKGGKGGKGTGNKIKGKKKQDGWDANWWVKPQGGVDVVGNGNSTATVFGMGATAGVSALYNNRKTPRWGGTSRVSGMYQIGSNSTTGIDARIGVFAGPHWKNFDIEAGPDLFWNRLSVPGFQLDPTFGVDLPITAHAYEGIFSAYAGVAPTWLSNVDRRVDWSKVDTPGFGHEFSYFAGVGLRAEGILFSLGYTYRVTVAGPQQGFNISADVGKVFSGGTE